MRSLDLSLWKRNQRNICIFQIYFNVVNDCWWCNDHCRTMQTATGVFGSESHADERNEKISAISALNCPQIMAVELCRDRLVWLKSLMLGFLYTNHDWTSIILMHFLHYRVFVLVIWGEGSASVRLFSLQLIFQWQVLYSLSIFKYIWFQGFMKSE